MKLTIEERWQQAKAEYQAALTAALECVKTTIHEYEKATGGQKLPAVYLVDSPWQREGKFPFNCVIPSAPWHYVGSLKIIRQETDFYSGVTPELLKLYIQQWEDSR